MARYRSWLVGALCVVLLLVAIRALTSRETEVAGHGLPSAEELDSLSRYLARGEPAAGIDSYAVFIPATPAPVDAPPAAAPAPPAVPLELSAILISGARPVAIINDEAVSAGSRLQDGSTVLDIQRDHVVVRRPDGTSRRLTLSAG
jgi:hypothetical protein